MKEPPGGGGGRLGSILDGMCEHNFEGNGSFFSFKWMAWMDKFSFKMGVILAWSCGVSIFIPLIETYILLTTLINTFNTCVLEIQSILYGYILGNPFIMGLILTYWIPSKWVFSKNCPVQDLPESAPPPPGNNPPNTVDLLRKDSKNYAPNCTHIL